MFRIFRYLILISLISGGLYFFVSEYFNLIDDNNSEKKTVNIDKIENKEEIFQEKKAIITS